MYVFYDILWNSPTNVLLSVNDPFVILRYTCVGNIEFNSNSVEKHRVFMSRSMKFAVWGDIIYIWRVGQIYMTRRSIGTY